MEAVIVAGLKRSADRTTTAVGAQGGLDPAAPKLATPDPAAPKFAAPKFAAPKLADLGGVVAAAARVRFGRLADWAVGRALGPNSLTGISLLLALCAAAWFSGGAGNDIIPGMLALSGWLLARVSAGRLAAIAGRQTGRSRHPASGTAVSRLAVSRLAVSRLAVSRLSGCRSAFSRSAFSRSAFSRSAFSRSVVSRSAFSRSVVSGSAVSRSVVSRLVASRSVLFRSAACGVMTGSTDWLVLPGASWDDGPDQVLPAREEPADGDVTLGTVARNVVWPSAVCAAAAECAIYAGIAAGGQSDGWTGMWPLAAMAIIAVALREAIGSCGGFRSGSVLAPPVGARVALAAVALAVHGPRVALFVVLAVEVISICHAIAVIGKATRSGGPATGDLLPGAGAARCGQAGTPIAVPTRQDVVLANRDDGAVARWAGRVVRGNLIPLPAALVGVAASVMLAALGLGNLPGVIALTPPAVMMLAAPGSGHPHDGRFDWLVPAVLQAGQYIYLAALGFASAVPGPVVYSLCAVTAVWYANLTADSAGTLAMLRRERGEDSSPTAFAGTPVGWEGRMFAATLGAMLGMATFVYLAVAAYLGVLIGRKVVIGYLLPREGDRR